MPNFKFKYSSLFEKRHNTRYGTNYYEHCPYLSKSQTKEYKNSILFQRLWSNRQIFFKEGVLVYREQT